MRCVVRRTFRPLPGVVAPAEYLLSCPTCGLLESSHGCESTRSWILQHGLHPGAAVRPLS